jgi:amino acid transporter
MSEHKVKTEHATGSEQRTGQLGTFAGVFTPSILTILGIILFLRLGYVTGSSGVGRALIILAIANLITIITSQSLAAIATNLKVKGGGDYYLISRTLGYKFGGSIGIVLFLAQSVSVGFYCIGFAEALYSLIPELPHPAFLAATAIAALFVLAWLGADWATKFQYIVMTLIVAALVSFFVGGIGQWHQSVFIENWAVPSQAPPFWVVFAVFFPAVTGFTQGVSMSGDLKDPGKSLPLGTFLAVGLSILVYLFVMIIFAGVLPNAELANDYQAMQRVARFSFLIDAGVIAATLSSAMASFMGAPRILQSLAADRIFPLLHFFAQGSGPADNPRRGVVLTGAIALATISLGQLNLIAHVVSMFFLISYGLLNYATYFEADTESASFRPRFRFFNKYVSLAGCFLCLSIILALDLVYGLVAFALMFAIYVYLRQSDKPSRWADSSRSYAYRRVRSNLLRMNDIAEHPNDWYPHILAFTNHRENREKLLRFGDWISGNNGLMTAVNVVPGSGMICRRRKAEALAELQEDIGAAGLPCFTDAICSDDFSKSMGVLLQAHGVGPLKANTVLANWHHKPDDLVAGLEQLRYGHNLRSAFIQGYNLVVFHCKSSRWDKLVQPDSRREKIDIWWETDDDSSRLMLLFAYLTTRSEDWKNAEIRVITSDSPDFLEARDRLAEFFDEVRIPAEPIIVDDMAPETILAYSREADLVFLPFKIKHSLLTDSAGYSLERVLPQLSATALVMAAEEIDLDALPEEGSAGMLAEAMDDLLELEKKLHRLEKEHDKAALLVEKLNLEIKEKSGSADVDEAQPDTLLSRKKELRAAEQNAEKIFRRTAKTRALYEDALARVKELGGTVKEEEI